MHVFLFKDNKGREYYLTTEAIPSDHPLPMLRIENAPEKFNRDFGPADVIKFPGQGEAYASELVITNLRKIGIDKLPGQLFDAAIKFLSQWPDGPQLTDAIQLNIRK